MELVLKGSELGVAGLKQVASRRTQIILGCSLNSILGVEELDLSVEGLEVHELSGNSSISRHNKFKGRWKLPHAGVKLVQQGDEVFSMGTHHSMLPGHVVELDHTAAAVQDQSKGFHDRSPKQHGCFTRQQVHLHIAVFATDA